MEGGIISPMTPATDISAVASALSYPTSIMAGMISGASAATVAGADPEIAAKKQALITQTAASPHFLCPTNVWANSMSRFEIPALPIILPPKIKNGIANKTNLLLAA